MSEIMAEKMCWYPEPVHIQAIQPTFKTSQTQQVHEWDKMYNKWVKFITIIKYIIQYITTALFLFFYFI